MHSRLFLPGGVVAAAFIAAACSPTAAATSAYGPASPGSAPSAAPAAIPSPRAAAFEPRHGRQRLLVRPGAREFRA